MNDLVCGEIVRVPSRSFEELKSNFLERLYPDPNGVKLRNERMHLGPCVAVVGNRYAPPYLIGGLTHPITGQPNGEVKEGAVVDSLFGVNAIGYVNHEADPAERARIKVLGVIVDRQGQPINLSRFREALPEPECLSPEPYLILVGGYSTDTGKTMCARALVSELQKRGYHVTVEKKTGTACCRDWLRCYAEPDRTPLENEGDEIVFAPDRFPARDFVDGLGIASDVSLETSQFVQASIKYTRAILAQTRPDFHVIELADSISHISNLALLRSKYFRQRIKTFVYSSVPTHEAVSHFLAYLRSLGYRGARVLLSGPLANEHQYDMARVEVQERLSVSICRSAIMDNGRWIPEGSELAGAVLERTS